MNPSGKNVLIPFLKFSLPTQVYGTELAVTLAISLFEHLAAEYKRGDSEPLSPSSSTPAALPSASNILAPFVAANEDNLGWKARELDGFIAPAPLETLIVQWITEDLNVMGEWKSSPVAARFICGPYLSYLVE